MGLATVYGTVTGHKGAITVESEVGKGTVFSVYLPVLITKDDLESQEKKHAFAGANEHVLVVDDDIDIRSMIADSLTLFGYQVEMVENGPKAIQYLIDKNHVDLVILDNDMPLMSGLETLDKMKKLKKDIKILFMSGMSKDFDKIIHENPENVKLMNKPFTLYELSKCVHDMLC